MLLVQARVRAAWPWAVVPPSAVVRRSCALRRRPTPHLLNLPRPHLLARSGVRPCSLVLAPPCHSRLRSSHVRWPWKSVEACARVWCGTCSERHRGHRTLTRERTYWRPATRRDLRRVFGRGLRFPLLLQAAVGCLRPVYSVHLRPRSTRMVRRGPVVRQRAARCTSLHTSHHHSFALLHDGRDLLQLQQLHLQHLSGVLAAVCHGQPFARLGDLGEHHRTCRSA